MQNKDLCQVNKKKLSFHEVRLFKENTIPFISAERHKIKF